MFTITNEELNQLRKTYLNKKVRVIINDEYEGLVDKVGVVNLIDDTGTMFGTWGSLGAIYQVDKVELLEE